MLAKKYIRDAKAYVWKETFAILKSKKPPINAFAVIQDKNETTVIIEESKIDDKEAINIKKDFKILTFDMILPFGLVGFLAYVSNALAKKQVSIFAISAFSTDHILVKEKDLSKAVKTLQTLGFIIKYNKHIKS